MRDFLGEELSEGDSVVFIEPSYRSLYRGVIERITPKKVRLSYTRGGPVIEDRVTYRFPSEVMKILT